MTRQNLRRHFPTTSRNHLKRTCCFTKARNFEIVVRGWVERIRFRLTVYRDGPKEKDFHPGSGANRSASKPDYSGHFLTASVHPSRSSGIASGLKIAARLGDPFISKLGEGPLSLAEGVNTRFKPSFIWAHRLTTGRYTSEIFPEH